MFWTFFVLLLVTTGGDFKALNHTNVTDDSQENELDSKSAKIDVYDEKPVERSSNQTDVNSTTNIQDPQLRAVFKKTPKSTVCTASGKHTTINPKNKKTTNYDSGNEAEKMDGSRSQIGVFWKFGIVPYYVNTTHYDASLMARIKEVMNVIESASCIRFKQIDKLPKSQIYDHIYFYNPTKIRECPHFDLSGPRRSGLITLPIGYNCLSKPQILHSLLHGLGLTDEIKHPLRDQFVHVLWDNVQSRYLSLFKHISTETYLGKANYDPYSVMHFHERGFTKNGKPTIQPLKPGFVISPSDSLTLLDRKKLQIIIGGECDRKIVNSIKDTCMSGINGKSKKESQENDNDLKKQKKTKKNEAQNEDDVSSKPIHEADEDNDDSNDTSSEKIKPRNIFSNGNKKKHKHKKKSKRITVQVLQEDW